MVTRIAGIIMTALAAGMLIGSPLGANASGHAVNAATVAEHLDKTKYSSAEIKAYLKSLKEAEITASGKIDEIFVGKTGNRVVVFVKAPGRGKEFVVDVYIDDASKLHKGEHVSCKGEYVKYNMFTLNGITLKKGSCSGK